MKIAVATIALNEASFVRRWYESAKDADYLVIGDTGSEDDTINEARSRSIHVHSLTIKPWRFDDARNALLALIPADIDVVVTLDMDEVLMPGWRSKLEAAPSADRYLYDYLWSDDIRFTGERCVSRNNWRWKHPVHETLQFTGEPEMVAVNAGFVIKHLPDDTKSRSQYLPLLAKAAQESPNDDRIAHYYARELFFHGRWAAARVEFMRHLGMPSAVWADERAQSYRYLAKMDDYPERWLLKACAEAPHLREPWVDLARHYMAEGRKEEAAGMMARALSITQRLGTYISEDSAWNDAELEALVR